jgi:hypothetical protein
MMGGRFGVLKPMSGDSVICPFPVSFGDLLMPGVREYEEIKMQRIKFAVKTKYHQIKTITLRSRVLPEKLTGPQLLKKFPAFYGTLRYITAFTKARHLSIS